MFDFSQWPWERLLAAGVGALTAQILYIVIVNRTLSRMRSTLLKPVLLFEIWLGITAILVRLGYLLPPPSGLAVVLAVLAFLVLRESYELSLRRRLRGSLPVENHSLWPKRPGVWATLSRPVTTTDLNVCRYRVPLKGTFSRGGDGNRPSRLRVAHLSDFHSNERLPLSFYHQAVEQANRYDPDLVFLTGDFISWPRDVALLPKLLEGLHSRYGIFAIMGNHDHWAGVQPILDVFEQLEIHYLGNGWQRLQPDGLPSLLLLGCEAPWNQAGAGEYPQRKPDEVLLALSHTADHVYEFSRMGVQGVFSGHFHAGQFRLPYLGALILPSRYGRRFDHGHYQVGETHLFVSAGVGCGEPGVRLYCPPDMYIIDFEFEG